MFEKLAVKDIDQQAVDFIDLYARFCADAEKTDPMDKAAVYRMRKFEHQVQVAWEAVPENKRPVLVEALLIKKLLPEQVKFAMKHLEAKVVSIV